MSAWLSHVQSAKRRSSFGITAVAFVGALSFRRFCFETSRFNRKMTPAKYGESRYTRLYRHRARDVVLDSSDLDAVRGGIMLGST